MSSSGLGLHSQLGLLTALTCAGYFDAPAALACPWGQTSTQLPAVCLVFCALEGAAAMKVSHGDLHFLVGVPHLWRSFQWAVYDMGSSAQNCPHPSLRPAVAVHHFSQLLLQASKSPAYEAALGHYRDCIRTSLLTWRGYECQVGQPCCGWLDICMIMACCTGRLSFLVLVYPHTVACAQACVLSRRPTASSCWHFAMQWTPRYFASRSAACLVSAKGL